MKRVWTVIAGGSLVAAITLLWRGDYDGAFIAAALGVVAWSLNLRARFSASLPRSNDDDEEP